MLHAPRPPGRSLTWALLSAVLLLGGTGAVLGATAGAAQAACGTTNLALNKPATSSSNENGSLTPNKAVDGNVNTRWSSAFSDPQWLQVDLGATTAVCQVVITWQTSYAKAFSVEVSATGAAGSWTPIYSTTTSTGGTQTLNVSGSGRYLRVCGTQRANGYGYSIKELAVYSGTTTEPPVCTNPPASGALPPTFIVFDPSMSAASIQSQVNAVFAQQESNQFGTQRYVLAFKPGTYSGINVNTGFYTSVIGLGRNPDDVVINGDVTVDAGWFGGNATQNFWRSIENLSIVPSVANNGDRWAVAQAAPMRRVHIRGKLNLTPNGYGYAAYKVADTVTSHEAWGMGSYCNFTADPSIVAEHGFETPVTAGVKFHDLLTVSLGGKGTIAHVINTTGGPAQGTNTVPVNLVSFP